jgi:hypothetical protein
MSFSLKSALSKRGPPNAGFVETTLRRWHGLGVVLGHQDLALPSGTIP